VIDIQPSLPPAISLSRSCKLSWKREMSDKVGNE
jgi:hypothetical protein